MNFKLVYFDDQIHNIDAFEILLKDQFHVVGSTAPSEFAQILSDHKPHGIMLDLHMPLEDGLVLHNKIVSSSHYNGCPIFFISGDISDESRLKMLQTGAIDFFNRSLSSDEVIVRLTNKIKAYLQGTPHVDIGNLRLNTENFTVHINHEISELTLIEIRILSYLVKAMPLAVEREELMMKLWGDASTKGKLSVHLSNMRPKLQDWNYEIKISEKKLAIVNL